MCGAVRCATPMAMATFVGYAADNAGLPKNLISTDMQRVARLEQVVGHVNSLLTVVDVCVLCLCLCLCMWVRLMVQQRAGG